MLSTKITSLFLLAVCTLVGCNQDDLTPAKKVQAARAQEAANSINFSENAEIDNIKRRLELTSKVGLIGYVVLFNDMGQPVLYTGIKGKVTSGGKRLTKPDRFEGTANSGGVVRQAPSDEGTYGSSGEYVFFWTTEDQFIQWNGRYLWSDKPVRLSVQPMVVTVSQQK